MAAGHDLHVAAGIVKNVEDVEVTLAGYRKHMPHLMRDEAFDNDISSAGFYS
jgi:hypothetical protein